MSSKDVTKGRNSIVQMYHFKSLFPLLFLFYISLSQAIDIRFYALQQHDILNGRNVFAQIYVHSKLMISDNKSIVGSCNINHRRYGCPLP